MVFDVPQTAGVRQKFAVGGSFFEGRWGQVWKDPKFSDASNKSGRDVVLEVADELSEFENRLSPPAYFGPSGPSSLFTTPGPLCAHSGGAHPP